MGYTDAQLDEIFGPLGSSARLRFNEWMRGQTRSLCQGPRDGLSADVPDDDPIRDLYENRGYPSCDVAHGGITYTYDVERYVDAQHPDHNLWD